MVFRHKQKVFSSSAEIAREGAIVQSVAAFYTKRYQYIWCVKLRIACYPTRLHSLELRIKTSGWACYNNDANFIFWLTIVTHTFSPYIVIFKTGANQILPLFVVFTYFYSFVVWFTVKNIKKLKSLLAPAWELKFFLYPGTLFFRITKCAAHCVLKVTTCKQKLCCEAVVHVFVSVHNFHRYIINI